MMKITAGHDLGANVFLGFGVVALLLSGVAVMWPKPSAKGLQFAAQRQKTQALVATKSARTRLEEVRKKVDALSWTDSADQVGPTSLAQVSALALKNHLKLDAFRPQRSTKVGDLTQLPFSITLSGPFPKVMAFEKELESPDNRLALTMLQISSSDETSDGVTATIGVVAFLQGSTSAGAKNG